MTGRDSVPRTIAEMRRELEGRRALVTGAGRGIGRAIALALAGAGLRITVAARTTAEVEDVAAQIRAAGGEATKSVCDVGDPNALAAMVAAAGQVDVLVNNAGISPGGPVVGLSNETWDQVLHVNLTAPFQLIRAVLPGMIERRWGRIINIASTLAKTGAPYTAAYTASKHGLLGLTRSVALEVVRHGITVNAICPGYVNTTLTQANVAQVSRKSGRSTEESLALLTGSSPQKRLIEPEEVAHLVLMLCDENARGITGQGLNVDGGTVLS